MKIPGTGTSQSDIGKLAANSSASLVGVVAKVGQIVNSKVFLSSVRGYFGQQYYLSEMLNLELQIDI